MHACSLPWCTCRQCIRTRASVCMFVRLHDIFTIRQARGLCVPLQAAVLLLTVKLFSVLLCVSRKFFNMCLALCWSLGGLKNQSVRLCELASLSVFYFGSLTCTMQRCSAPTFRVALAQIPCTLPFLFVCSIVDLFVNSFIQSSKCFMPQCGICLHVACEQRVCKLWCGCMCRRVAVCAYGLCVCV